MYYDKIGRLIGENYNRGLTGAGDAFSSKLTEAPFIEYLLQKVKEYMDGSLKTDTTQFVDSGVSNFIEKLKSKTKDTLRQTIEDTATSNNETALNPLEEKKTDEKEKEKEKETKQSGEEKIKILTNFKKPVEDKPGSKKNSHKKLIETLRLKRKTDSTEIKQKEEAIKPKEKYSYNADKERNVTKTIFTDGVKYVVQVSSWKNKRIAEKQKKLLEEMGYNAFITQVYIKRKHGTWNRVRVGYFNSLREAKKIEREIRRKIK